jgi:hypothetical protein
MFAALMIFAAYKGDGAALYLGAGSFVGGGVGYPAFESVNAYMSIKKIRIKYVDSWKIVEFGLGASGGLGLGIGALILRGAGFGPRIPAAGFEAGLISVAAAAIWLIIIFIPESLYARFVRKKAVADPEHAPAFLLWLNRNVKPVRRAYYAYIPLVFILSGDIFFALLLLLPVMSWITLSHAAFEHSDNIKNRSAVYGFMFIPAALSLFAVPPPFFLGRADARVYITAVAALHIIVSAYVFASEKLRGAGERPARLILSMGADKLILLYMLICFALMTAAYYSI